MENVPKAADIKELEGYCEKATIRACSLAAHQFILDHSTNGEDVIMAMKAMRKAPRTAAGDAIMDPYFVNMEELAVKYFWDSSSASPMSRDSLEEMIADLSLRYNKNRWYQKTIDLVGQRFTGHELPPKRAIMKAYAEALYNAGDTGKAQEVLKTALSDPIANWTPVFRNAPNGSMEVAFEGRAEYLPEDLARRRAVGFWFAVFDFLILVIPLLLLLGTHLRLRALFSLAGALCGLLAGEAVFFGMSLMLWNPITYFFGAAWFPLGRRSPAVMAWVVASSLLAVGWTFVMTQRAGKRAETGSPETQRRERKRGTKISWSAWGIAALINSAGLIAYVWPVISH